MVPAPESSGVTVNRTALAVTALVVGGLAGGGIAAGLAAQAPPTKHDQAKAKVKVKVGPRGIPGPAGPQGLAGAAGAAGTAGPSGLQGVGAIAKVSSGDVYISSGSWVAGTITCPPGTYAVGTGMLVIGLISRATPYSSFVGYFLANDLGFGTTSHAEAVCAAGTSWSQSTSALSMSTSGPTVSRALATSRDQTAWQQELSGLESIARRSGLQPQP